MNLLREFDDVQVQHVPRAYNEEADNLAHIGSGTKIKANISEKMIRIQKKSLPSVKLKEMASEDMRIGRNRSANVFCAQGKSNTS